ncbi:FtsK/SpoIIIE domain-containing protein [Saccharopolyspora sp. 6M]|uniref:FtsK/SpoIIIE domain-containing protein n=1 Tax=Saccharopolyspora sp. 6M TaxID=2877237 RepID=UPI00272AC2A3|nr:FtsK/SpoIIIE domain-containing protein [Saccharopolyspora sp. 6M]
MTTNPAEDYTTMGELLHLPVPGTHRSGQVEPTEPRDTAEHEDTTTPGTGLARDRERGVVPAALAGRAAAVRDHLREHGRDYAVTGGKFVARHGVFLLGGAWDTATSAYSRWTGRNIDAQVAAAQAAGDHGTAAQLSAQRNESRRLFLERIKVFGGLLVQVPVFLSGVSGLMIGVTLIVSVAAWVQPGGLGFTDVWSGLFEAMAGGFEWAMWAASWAPWAVLLVLGGLLVQGYNRRRDRQAAPEWARTQAVRTAEVVNVTPSAVVAALRNLGLPVLRKAIDDSGDGGAWMLGIITRYGPGAQVHVTLPKEVTVAKIMDRRDVLAGNLDRKAHEVQIEGSEDSEREFILWVANSGALDKPVPPSPLVDAEFGPIDIYRDLMPWGISPKGDAVLLNLLQQHLLLAGLSKQGKTAAARALLLWAACDPSVRIRLADLKGFGDWSMFEGLAEELIEGAGDANFIATCDMLEWGVEEMERRYDKWRELGRKGDVDRASSLAGSGFEPLIIVVDEVQKLFTCTTEHPEGGDIGGKGKKSRAVRAAQALHDQARAVNIHFWEFAQNPTDANLPVVVREGAMIRASLFVGTEGIAKMALGEAPVDTGAAPHALRAGLDRGTVVLAPGESMDLPGGATHTTVRTHYIGTEAAYTIAERAKSFRSGTQHHQDEPEQRDLLADVADVLGEEDKAKATDVVARLRTLAPNYRPYRGLNADKLKEHLDELGAKVTKVGVLTVYTERVHQALAAREGGNDTP